MCEQMHPKAHAERFQVRDQPGNQEGTRKTKNENILRERLARRTVPSNASFVA